MRRRSTLTAAAALTSLLFLFALPTDLFGASDLSVQSVASPVGSYQLGQPIPVEFTVLNSGADPAVKGDAFIFIFRVLPGGEKVQVYDQISDIVLDNGASVTLTPPSFTPNVAGTYELVIDLFASNDLNFDNNVRIEVFTVEDAPEPCTEKRPDRTTLKVDGSGGEQIIRNSTTHFIDARESLVLDFAAKGTNCCWDVTVSSVVVQGEGFLEIEGAASQQTTPGTPARYRFSLTNPATLNSFVVFRLDVAWSRCDSAQISGGETLVLVFNPDPEKAEEGSMTTGETPAAGISGDPVNTATGELFLPWTTDMAIGTGSPLTFRRYYGSNLTGFFAPTDELGRGFSHNYAWRLEQIDDITLVITPGGRTIVFEKEGEDWKTTGRRETTFRLIEDADGWRFGDPRRPLVRHFDTTGRLREIVDRNGNSRTVERVDGQITAVVDSEGRRLEVTRQNGRIVGLSDGTRTVGYRFENDLLVAITDPAGATDSLDYDSAGRLAGITRPEGNRRFTQVYDDDGRVTQQTDALGGVWTFSYDNDQTTITAPDGTTEVHEHSPDRRFRERVDQSGESFTILYDDRGRRIGLVDRLGDTTRTTFDDESGLITRIESSDGTTTTYMWNRTEVDGLPFYDLVGVDYPDGTTARATYDGKGNLLSSTDRLGSTTTYTYDERGRIRSADIDGRENLLWFHGPKGRIDSIVSDSRSIAYSYDDLDRVVEQRSADGRVTRFTWNDANRPVRRVDPDGTVTSYGYDANGNVTSVVDRTGAEWRIEYDPLDRVALVVDPEGGTTRRLYSNRGHLAAVVGSSDDTIRIERDDAGRVVGLVDPIGNRRSWTYDLEGIVVESIDPRGSRTRATTDLLGRITATTDPLGLTTRYRYDELGRIVETIDPTGRATSATRDAGGRLTSLSVPGGIKADYAWGPTGYLSEITDPNGNLWQTLQDGSGRLIADVDPLGNRIDYRYDDAGHLADVDLPGDLGSIELDRDDAGRMTHRRSSDGTVDSLAYDAEGRVIRIDTVAIERDRLGRVVANNGIAIRYDLSGRIERLDYGGGRVLTYLYDRRGLLSGVVDWLGDTTSVEFDAAGLITKLTRPNGIETSWRYDGAGRLVEIAEGDLARIVRELDSLGRPTSIVRTGYLSPTILDDSLGLDVDDASQIASFDYDEIGRLLDDGNRTYRWDPSSRLRAMTDADGSTDWSYDPLGHVLERTDAETTTRPIRSGAFRHPHAVVDRAGDGSDRHYYVRTPSGYLLYAIDAATGRRTYYHFDEVGSTQLLSDDDGAITDRYAYTPYGRIVGREGEAGQRYTFAGAWGIEQEGGTGLYRMGARLYDAMTGRFISRDPARLLDPRQLNRYRYGLGNPLLYVDVDGRTETSTEQQTRALGSGFRGDGGGIGALAHAFYGISSPPAATPSNNRAIREIDGTLRMLGLVEKSRLGDLIGGADDEIPETDGFDDEDPIELGDGEVIFGSGDVGSSYTPGSYRRRQAAGSWADVTGKAPGLSVDPLPDALPEVQLDADPRALFDAMFGGSDILPPEVPGSNATEESPSQREANEKMVVHPLFGIPVPARLIPKEPPPLNLDDPEPVDPDPVDFDPIELGDGEQVL